MLAGGPKLYFLILKSGMMLVIATLILNRCDPHVCFYCLSTEHVPADLSDSIGCSENL